MANRRYIAIIDDDESLCRSMARLLQLAGMHAISYGSAEEFLADRLSDQFACLLVDVQLPGISGNEMQRQLVARGSKTPVIYITAYDDTNTRAEALASGCAGFFRKTDPGQDIIAAIRRAIGSRDHAP
jgi:FixJ family two-component response regulator